MSCRQQGADHQISGEGGGQLPKKNRASSCDLECVHILLSEVVNSVRFRVLEGW